MPTYLDAAGKRYWKKTVAYMLRLRTLTDGDEALVSLFAQACGDRDRLERKIRKEGEVIKGSHGTMKRNPRCILLKERCELILKCTARLGLDPSSRASVGPIGASGEDDPWDKL